MILSAQRSSPSIGSMRIASSRFISKAKLSDKKMANFRDLIHVRVRGGTGGDGMSHFGREPFKPIAPPDGGDGGRGGHVYLEITRPTFDLSLLKTMYSALPGGRGQTVRGKGYVGEDVVVPVPKGTVVSGIPRDNQKREQNMDTLDHINQQLDIEKEEELYIDTSHHELPVGTRFLVAMGGVGGYGNYRFKTSLNRSPMESTPGEPGQDRRLRLELKTIADVGLVGLPNAGKSSFIKAVTRFDAEVGSWAFTTLTPSLGTIDVFSFLDNETFTAEQEECSRIIVADIPGIVKGASENRGLGHSFLRHIERATVLCFVVDLSAENSVDDLSVLLNELKAHEEATGAQTRNLSGGLIIANKADAIMRNGQDIRQLVRENLASLEQWTRQHSPQNGLWSVVPISAKYKKNLGKAVGELQRLVIHSRQNLAKSSEPLSSVVRGVYGIEYPADIKANQLKTATN